MRKNSRNAIPSALAGAVATLLSGIITGAVADQPTSYMPVNITEDFPTTMHRMQAAKPEIEKRQQDLLEQRYDLGDHPAKGVTMSGGKVIQEGVRVKLPAGVTWDSLASMTPEQAVEHFGWIGHFAGRDMAGSSQRTRDLLGWKAEQPGLLADLDRPAYFAG